MFQNKKKIFNDPIYGFINIPDDLTFDLIEHSWFQRLRRITQLGMTHFVYPGALHTRFHHALGSMHLMMQAIETLRSKGVEITENEARGAQVAILLHDIGHGPYSHGLENSIVFGMNHEDLSLIYIKKLNEEFNNSLLTAIEIFSNSYHKKFLHKLVSSQLDMDRLDYLKRDSFYTGVSEGVINSDRIITMLSIAGDELVVESKGIYSVEKFIVARRLMYWQVYFHKTVMSAESLMIKILDRARFLTENGETIFTTPPLKVFLEKKYVKKDFLSPHSQILNTYSLIDDYDILSCIKVWTKDKDRILSILADKLVNRKLFRIEMQNKPFEEEYINQLKEKTMKYFDISFDESDYFVFSDNIKNNLYTPKNDKILIMYKDGKLTDISEASDQLNVDVLSKTVVKYFLCYPKSI